MSRKQQKFSSKDARSVLEFYHHFGLSFPRGMKAILKRLKEGKKLKADIKKLRDLIMTDIGAENCPAIFKDVIFKPLRKESQKLTRK